MSLATFMGLEPSERRIFQDRREAGRLLARKLQHHAGTNAVVLGLPRGGVPVADEIARAIGGTLDVWVVRKLGAPQQPELGLGAIAEGPAAVIDDDLVAVLGVTSAQLTAIAQREMAEVRRRVELLRGGRPAPSLQGRNVIIVDDGIATGGTVRAAVRAVRAQEPARVVVATPIASPDVIARLRVDADEVVCLHEARDLVAIGLWYHDFEQVADDEVTRILDRARADALH